MGDMPMDEFVRNAWYPAAWSRDISRNLEQRRILGELVVLYRTTAGAAVGVTTVPLVPSLTVVLE